MAREALAEDAVVAKIIENFVPVLMDTDKEKEWSEKHGVTNLPIIQFTDGEGEVMSFTEDVKPAAEILEDMATALEFLSDDFDE